MLMLVGMDPVSSISLGSRTSINWRAPLSKRRVNSSSFIPVFRDPPASVSASTADATEHIEFI